MRAAAAQIKMWEDICGTRYEGQLNQHGAAHWQGVISWSNGGRYEGEFRNHKCHGHGTMKTYPDGSVTSGQWEDDKFLG